jgi:hypothetical protein
MAGELDVLAKLLINPVFRWVIYFATLGLVIYAYIIEPARFSTERNFLGITKSLESFISMCFTIMFYLLLFLGLWLTIPFSDTMPDMWYVPMFAILFAIITQLFIDTPAVKVSNALSPPPKYIPTKPYRRIVYYAILVLDIIIFIQGFIYAGISKQFKTTILHQFILNRFGGTEPQNMLNFLTEWFGIIGLILDGYWVYGLETFSACSHGLPASWDI